MSGLSWSMAERPSHCQKRLAHSSNRAFVRRALRGLAAIGLLASSLVARDATAADVEVESTTAAQAYEVASPWGDTAIERRRVLQMLGLAVYNLQGKSAPGEAAYSLILRLRFDADFGVNGQLVGAEKGGETDYGIGAGTRFIAGLQEAPLDLMVAYIEGQNVAHRWLGFRLGRQYVSDVLGWWSFDGGLVRVTTPYFAQIEVYGGLEQRGGLPLSTSRFERQGVWRGSYNGFGGPANQPDVTDFPSYQAAQAAPAFGLALETSGLRFVHGRFTYRRVYNTGSSVTQQFPGAGGGYRTLNGTRLSQERLGYSTEINAASLGAVKGGFTYDLYGQLVGSFYGGIDAYAGSRVTLGADVDYFVPTFDADSIWNWFTHEPVTTITGRTTVDVTREVNMSASAGVRRWAADGDPDTFGAGQCQAAGQPSDCVGKTSLDPSTPDIAPYSRSETNRATSTTNDVLANLAGRYRTRTAELGLRGMLQTGDRGRRMGADASAERRIWGERFALGIRVSLYDWTDPLRRDRDATSFGYVLGAGYKPSETADFKLEWEHDMNRLVGQRFRVVGVLSLRVAP